MRESVLQQHDGDLCKGGHDSHGSNGYCEREWSGGGGLGRERGERRFILAGQFG